MAAKKKTGKKKTSKKRKSSKKNRKAAIQALARQPLGTLVRKAANISAAIKFKEVKKSLKENPFVAISPKALLRVRGEHRAAMLKAARERAKTRRGNAAIDAIIANS